MRKPLSSFSQQVILYLSLIIVTIIVFLSTIIVYDPLQIFTKSETGKLHTNMRYQTLGIILQHADKFESIIMGSSVFENTSAKEASVLFNEKFANLSVTASDSYERHLILSFLFARKPIKTVIYSLDHTYLYQDKGYFAFPTDSWTFLYNENRLDDIKIYLNQKLLRCLVEFSDKPSCAGTLQNLDHPNDWSAQPNQARRFGGLDNWIKAKQDGQLNHDLNKIVKIAKIIREKQTESLEKYTEPASNRAKRYVDEYIVSLVKEHPDTQFLFVFPPYSRAYLSGWYQHDLYRARIHEDVIRHLAKASTTYSNMHVYGFEDANFLDDIANYKDLVHFSPSINSLILHKVVEKKHEINEKNVDTYMDNAKQKGLAYDLSSLAKLIEPHLK